MNPAKLFNLELLSWMFAGGIATAVGLGILLAGSTVVDVASAYLSRRRILYPYFKKEPAPAEQFELERELCGGINWNLAGLAGTLILGWGALIIAPRMPIYGLLAGSGAFVASRFVRSAVRERREWEIRLQVREFLSSLRLSLAMKPTIPLALQKTAKRTMGKGVFAERLRYHVQTRLFTTGAVSVIEALSQEFDSEPLKGLLVRLQAAKQGGLSLPEALKRAAQEMEAEMMREAEFAIEDAPTRLTFPMLGALFPPLIILPVVPLLANVLRSLGEI